MSAEDLVHQLRLQLWEVTYNRYLTEELFSWQWWGLIAMLFFFYAVWWKLTDRTRLLELLLFGSLVAVQASLVDIAGVTAALWQYNYRLFPVSPAPFPFDYTVVPILLMLAYQYGPSWGSYLSWSAVASAIFSFVITPIFQVTGMKTFFNWNFGYFFVLMMAAAVVARLATGAVLRATHASRARPAPAHKLAPLLQPMTKPLPDDTDEESG